MTADVARSQYDRVCAHFDARVRAWLTLYTAPLVEQRVILIRDEFASVGMAQHWSKRRFALWTGLALNRTVYFQTCRRVHEVSYRMPLCNTTYFDFDDYFELVGGQSLRAPVELFDLPASNATPSALFASTASILALSARNPWALNEVRAAIPNPPGLTRRSYNKCTGYAVSRPSETVRRSTAPIFEESHTDGALVSLHLRSVEADFPGCFPASTPVDAFDATFGNRNCVARAFDYWRFKLLGPCGERHVADVFPLTEWISCAAERSRGTSILFLTADVSAINKLDNTLVSGVRLRTLGEGPIAHTHYLRRGGGLSEAHMRDSFARGAADWYVLTRSSVIFTPIQSAFSRSACLPFAERCPISFVSAFHNQPCAGACFSECRRSNCTHYTPAYMGRRISRMDGL